MEAFEEVTPVVGTGGRFGMILHAHDGQGLVTQAFQGLVVEVDVGGFHIVQAVQHHMEAVVLGRDLDAARAGWLQPWWPNFSLAVVPPRA